MKVAFYFTLACTARCAHCITFAAPGVGRKMSLPDARRLLADVGRTPELDGVVFTGGENFVHRDELLQLVRDCAALRLKTEIISNAYWASSEDAARRMLRPFVDAGLDSLRISLDEYHLPFIPAARVHIALRAMSELGLLRQITCVVPHRATRHRQFHLADALSAQRFDLEHWDTAAADALAERCRHHWPPELIALLTTYGFALNDLFLVDDAIELRDGESRGGRRLADYFLRTRTLVQYQTLATEGRGRELLGDVELKHVDETADMVCNSVGFTPTVSPEGDVFPCCSSWVNVKRLRSGNVSEMPLATAIDRVRHDPIALFMHHQGPRALIKYLRDKGEDLPPAYSHPCHLCGTALERYSREQLAAHIEQFYADQPWRMLFTTRGFSPDTTAVTPFLPVAAATAPPLTLARARKFFGVLRPGMRRSGIRIEGSVDELVAHLRALGRKAELAPIEDGAPKSAHVALLRTSGSPWVEVLQPPQEPLVGDDLLRDLSAHTHRRVLEFEYAFGDGCWRHRLFSDGRMVEMLNVGTDAGGVSFSFASDRQPVPDHAAVRDDPAAYVQAFLTALRVREWGISLDDLGRGDIPFPPTLMVESFFMRLS
jgi:hypothetical protein